MPPNGLANSGPGFMSQRRLFTCSAALTEPQPIFAGSSYIQAVSWDGHWPEVRSIVTYSQSTAPDSSHFSDMTQLFSEEGWVQLPYRMGDIESDPELEVRHLMERR